MIKWNYKPSGLCPVQSEGWFRKSYFYFRSRGEQATLSFYKNEEECDDIFAKEHAYFILYKTNWPKAGYLPRWKCILLIYWGCFKYLLCRAKKEK